MPPLRQQLISRRRRQEAAGDEPALPRMPEVYPVGERERAESA